MPRGRMLTDKEKALILAHHKHGLTQRAIAKEVGRSRGCIQKFLNKPNPRQSTKQKPRNVKLSPTTIRAMVWQASRTRCSAANLQKQYNLPVSVRRVQQILSGIPHLRYQRMPRGPYMTKLHKLNTVKWSKEKLEFGAIKWKRIIFTDEKKFNLDGPDGLACYWHDLRKTPELFSKRQQGGGSLMIWAAISYWGTSDLDHIEGIQDSVKYCQTLERSLLPFAADACGENWTLMHDGASIHRSNHTKAWLADLQVEVLDWPAKSPDLNPIENVWGRLARSVYEGGVQFDSVEALARKVVDCWNDISVGYLRSLYHSMPRRLVSVIEGKGATTPY